MSNSPAGVQIYLVTTFLFTLGQSAALRNDSIRRAVGLPALGGGMNKPLEPVLATKFKTFAQKQQQDQRSPEEGVIIGKGVLRPESLPTASLGSSRPSSIVVGKATQFPLVSEDEAAMEAANLGDKKNFTIHRQRPQTILVTDNSKGDQKNDTPPLNLKRLTNKNKRNS